MLQSARLDLADFERREGEVLLVEDVIDHQLVDVDGVRVIRAADLYVAKVGAMYRLVGVDVSMGTLLRRLGPTRWRTRPTPERVIDWAAIQPFGRPGSPIRLREGNRALHRLRPSELADLLEELGRRERQELLAALEPETAADALEEMDAEELESLLRESGEEQAAALLAVMEPDEAVDALRDLEEDERDQLLGMMPEEKAAELRKLLGYEERTAGGLMTSYLLIARRADTVADVRARLVDDADHQADLPGVLVVDNDGRLVDDISLFELLVADAGREHERPRRRAVPGHRDAGGGHRRRRRSFRRRAGLVARGRRRRRPSDRPHPRRRPRRRARAAEPCPREAALDMTSEATAWRSSDRIGAGR